MGLGIMSAAFGVPGVLLQPMAGALVDRLGVRTTMTVATLGYGCCCARLVMSESVVSASAARLVMGACLVFRARWTWVGCCMLFTLCCGLGASVNALAIDAAVREVPRESAGSPSAVVTAAGTLARLVMQFGCMSTTLIPGSTAHGRVIGCALVIIAFALVAARAAHRLDRQG